MNKNHSKYGKWEAHHILCCAWKLELHNDAWNWRKEWTDRDSKPYAQTNLLDLATLFVSELILSFFLCFFSGCKIF